ncbi:hypothetical protein [Planctomyces sp. SH-PL62]|uniref:hypothetical protein n=1 Tax=Planctomyces sp. SH-PL62 TaxID=1636152 RepID=UPI00078DA3AA|nr:hypothetical protein [Planctomyces sp. SH-PL62]AMV36469.1 hypothetical protein VT85_03490 [Planctomyces sp. SH-PL62]
MSWPRFFVFVFGVAWGLAIWLPLRMAIGRFRGVSRLGLAAILVAAAMVHLYGFRHFADLRDWAYHEACEREFRQRLELRVNLDDSASSLELHRGLRRAAFDRLLRP